MKKIYQEKTIEEKWEHCMKAKTEEAALKRLLRALGGPFSYSEIWKYRNFFEALPEEGLSYPSVRCALLAVVRMLAFDLPGARVFQEQIPEGTFAANYLWTVLPEKRERWRQGMEDVLAEFSQELPTEHITMGRPTLYNGIWSLEEWSEDYLQREDIKNMFPRCYGEQGQGMYEILQAEICYQKNQCFEALSLEVGNIYHFERTENMAALFVGLYIQLCVMIVTGQLPAVQYVMEQVSRRVQGSKSREILKNVEALAAWCALYDRNYSVINTWMTEKAPNEYGELCLLDLFSYLVKLRIYLMQRKHFALMGLAERLLPLLRHSERKVDHCEVAVIMALSLSEQGHKKEAFDLLDEILEFVKECKFYRLVADEGADMYRLLWDYREARGLEEDAVLEELIEISKKMGILFPGYMEQEPEKEKELTKKEREVLRQLAAERTNGEIAEYLHVSLNTVKYHTKKIFEKLGVQNRQKAVKAAKERGIL